MTCHCGGAFESVLIQYLNEYKRSKLIIFTYLEVNRGGSVINVPWSVAIDKGFTEPNEIL